MQSYFISTFLSKAKFGRVGTLFKGTPIFKCKEANLNFSGIRNGYAQRGGGYLVHAMRALMNARNIVGDMPAIMR